MGTSSSYQAPNTPAWTQFKSSMTRFLGGRISAGPVVEDYVVALGGAGAAANLGSLTTSASRLGSFLAASAQGFAQALEQAGLADVVGRDFGAVIAALVDWIAGAGNTHEAAEIREAATDVLVTLYAEAEFDPMLFETISRQQIDEATLQRSILQFVRNWVITDIWRRGGDRAELLNLSARELKARQDEMTEYVAQAATVHFGKYGAINLLRADWNAPEVQAAIQDIVNVSLHILGVPA